LGEIREVRKGEGNVKVEDRLQKKGGKGSILFSLLFPRKEEEPIRLRKERYCPLLCPSSTIRFLNGKSGERRGKGKEEGEVLCLLFSRSLRPGRPERRNRYKAVRIRERKEKNSHPSTTHQKKKGTK